MASTEVNNVDHRAPDVRHLVYSMYRKMLTGYNDQANEIVDALPRDMVQEDADIYTHLDEVLRQQTNVSQGGDSVPGGQLAGPPPPPPPSFPGSLPGRRLKTEIPERSLEPPAAIQNAMMTKDKKPFTYTPGGIDLSEIRSPRMARRINRNACADEIPGLPAPNITNNQQPPVEHPGNTHFSAIQSQLPAQVLPPVGIAPPPPPPPPPQSNSSNLPPPPPVPTAASAVNNIQPKTTGGRPPLGFDPNELFARVNKSPAYEPVKSNREEPMRIIQNQPVEEKPTIQSNHQKPQSPKANEIGQNIYVPLQNEPGHIFVPQVTPKVQKESPSYTPPASSQTGRAQLGSIYIPAVAPTHQEQNAPSPSTPYGAKNQLNSSMASSPAVETKQQAPWVTVYRTPQSSVPWANREPESPKPANTRIIPIQIEGRDSPKPTIQSPQSQVIPPPFLQHPQMRQQNQIYQHQQQPQQKAQQQPQQQMVQQQPQSPHTRVIPIQIEGGASINQQPRSPVGGINQNKFNPMIPQSPTPYSPAQEKEQKPQWAPVQPKTPKKEIDRPQYKNEPARTPQQQQPQPEYGTYNTAGVPLNQLRKMQLSDDDRALMDKFKSQVERQGNDILNDENTNPRYRGGYIPSKVFKMLDESVDEENYLHNESDPRYRGAVIPSRAFRMLQSMTDTAGDMPHQVPKSQPRTPTGRPLSGAPFQQDAPLGPYVPPSEQQVQEPRKYTGGSIPSRSFKMLQAMTGQEVPAPNTSGSTRGRETLVFGINQWCPSPCPSPIDPFWGYYPPDPYFMCNFIPDWNAAYGSSPYHQMYPQIPPFHPYHYQMYQNCANDSDEQGYSSSDELAQYHANYWRNFMYSTFHTRSERCSSTPNSFLGSRDCVTPVCKIKKNEKIVKEGKAKDDIKKQIESKEERIAEKKVEGNLDEEDEEIEDEESETDTEEGDKTPRSSMSKISGLQTLKSVSNVNIYTSESLATMVQEEDNNSIEVEINGKENEEKEEDEEEEEEEEEEEDDDEISSSESLEELDPKAPIPHQLSIILEESEHSDVESIRRKEGTSTIDESESCSTINNGNDDDESDNDILDSESSVIVRLPLNLKFDRTTNDEEITTVIVGDSEVRKNTAYCLGAIKKEEENFSDSENGDISVTFTVPSRSNSVISVEQKSLDSREKVESDHEQISENDFSEESKIDAEVTISLPHPKKFKNFLKIKDEKIEEENLTFDVKTEVGEYDDSSCTNEDNNDVIIKNEDGKKSEDKPKVENFKSWLEKENEKDCVETEETEKIELNDGYKVGVGKLEEMISTFLETTKHKISNSMESSQENLQEKISAPVGSRLNKKDSQEESEEDDSGVTSDVSNKQMNSETEADTESDYSELSKMTQFQRASTHSRLFKLLQEECEKREDEGKEEEEAIKTKEEESEILKVKKQKLTLPLNSNPHLFEVESLSSSSGIASPSSPTISDRLVKELIHSLLNKKKGKKFKKIPLAKLHAAALRILQEEMDPYDTSPTSGEDALFLSPTQKKQLHSSTTANFANVNEIERKESSLEKVYDDNYYDYLDYYNTWGNTEMNQADDCDVVPSKAFRMLREQTMSPKPIEGFKARCPRISSKKHIHESITGRATPIVTIQESHNELESLTFAEKQEKVAEVLDKYKKS